MDRSIKRGLFAVSVLVGIGIVATWATAGNPAYAQAYAPQVTSISSSVDAYGQIRLYRTWSDGLTELSRKLNGQEVYTPWQVVSE